MSTISASIDLPIDEKTASHPGAEGEVEKTLCRNIAPTVFAHGGDIGIYVNLEWAAPLLLHHGFERYLSPSRLVQGRDNSLLPIQRPTNGCPHTYNRMILRHFGNHAADVFQVFFETGGCSCSCAPQDVSLTICRGNHDLGPADVQSDKHCHSLTS